MSFARPQVARLPGNRLHLQHGPIDLVIRVEGKRDGVEQAYDQANRRFASVLEELVGEIHDETDLDEEEIQRINDDVVECDAGVDLRDLDEELDIALPQGEHRSLNGFLLEELGHVPEAGEYLVTSVARIDILQSSDTQVLRARVTRRRAAEEEADE